MLILFFDVKHCRVPCQHSLYSVTLSFVLKQMAMDEGELYSINVCRYCTAALYEVTFLIFPISAIYSLKVWTANSILTSCGIKHQGWSKSRWLMPGFMHPVFSLRPPNYTMSPVISNIRTRSTVVNVGQGVIVMHKSLHPKADFSLSKRLSGTMTPN